MNQTLNAHHGFEPRLHGASPRRPGFTVTELLVVVAIIAIVVGLVFVAFPKITGAAKAKRCMANQRSIASASMLYASDNKTRLVSPRTDPYGNAPGYNPFPQAGSYRHYWVAAFNAAAPFNQNLTPDNPQRETQAALRNGALWNYHGNIDGYRSPFDPTTRLRSYSLNGFVGVKFHDDSTQGALSSIPAQYRHDTTTLSRIPQPSRTMYSVSEWDRFDLSANRDFNFNGFLVHPDPSTNYWFDLPAMWHEDVTISFADGSTAAIPIRNRALLEADSDGHDFTEPAPALDFHEFRRMLLPGLIN
ncbi:MAG: prepilin-type N-terminal cleavage/methylation domain-containing protein [Phycisphaeraceae bacterium]|nr:prepilin-type N-terminal cleavage/methylation domain-containing protein [Phycisphaeraceae bacterium]